MNTDTPFARLERMITTARNGAEAAWLLSHLTVFQGFFPRAAVIAMAADDMTETQRVEAFATLCQWRLVRKISQRRYQIDAPIKALLPPSRDVLMRYLMYWQRQLSTSDDMLLYLYWDDIACALVWGLQHWPDKIAEMNADIPFRIWFIQTEWPSLIKMLSQFVTSGSLSESFPPTSSHPSSETWRDQVLEHYITMRTPRTQIYRMTRRAEATFMNRNLPLARQYYEQTVLFAASMPANAENWTEITPLQGLLNVLILQKDKTAIDAIVDQLLPQIQGNTYNLHMLGLAMMRIGDKPAARRYFANGLRLNQRVGEGLLDHYRTSLIFRDWGRLENGDGHFREAYALYHLALSEAMLTIERSTSFSQTPQLIEHIEWTWHEFEELNRQWHVIDAQHTRSVDKPSLRSP